MLWIKALHLIFMVTWFAGLFYLPRLFVYHALTEDNIGNERFKLMERKLFWGIMTPGGVLTLIFGSWLLGLQPGWLDQRWIWIKLGLIILLVLYHVFCGLLLTRFKHDRNRYNHIWYRWLNEVPVIFLVAIVLLAVLKPI